MGYLSDNSSMEGDLKIHGNNGILVDEAEEHVEMNLGLHPQMSGSPKKIEVSGNCINLFVEVFGPLDEIDEGYDDLNSRREHLIPVSRESNPEFACSKNVTISSDVQMASVKNEDECAFNVSDLVWVKARTQTWWPGTICHPSDAAAKDATKAEKRGPFLVKYFGNPYFTWCSNSDLRPFVEYFEQLSRQNDSRNFLGSVDKAVGEIGRQVKSMMTCHCFLKESRTLPARFSSEEAGKSQTPSYNASKFDDLYLSQFKPASFCSYIKNLACGLSVPNKVELIVAKTRLSTFYCSIGHYQLPMQLLRPSCDTLLNTQDNLKSKVINECQNTSGSVTGFERDDFIATRRNRRKVHSDGKLISFGKESELRERKKSKYLSSPFVEGDQNGEVSSTAGQSSRKDPKNLSSGSGKSTPSSKLTGKNSQERGSRNSIKGRFVVSKADNIDSCSAQLLSELHSLARDCFYPDLSRYSDSLKRFYCSFRTFAFLDFEMVHGILKSQKVPTGAMAKVQKKGKGKGKEKEKVKESGKNQGSNSESVLDNASIQEPEKDDQQGGSKQVKVKKKEEVSLSSGMEPAGNLLNTSHISTITNSCVTFHPQGSDIPKNKTAKKRKKGEASPTHIQLETEVSDITKNRTPTPKKRKKGEASPTHLQLENKGCDITKNRTPEKRKKVEAIPTYLQLENKGCDILNNTNPMKRERGEASPADLQLETQGSDIPKSRSPEKEKKGEPSPTLLQLETQGSDIPTNKTPKNKKKGEASPMPLQLGTQGADITKNTTLEKREKGEANPPRLQLEAPGADIPKNKTLEMREKGDAGPTHIQFETQDSDIQKNITPEKEKKGEASLTHLPFETTTRLPDLNGNILSISFENMPSGMSAMHQGKQNINGTERFSISGCTATALSSNLIHNAIDSSFHNSLQKILLPSNGKPERKKWKRKKETSQVTSVIPDLNGTTMDSPSLENVPTVEDHISPEGDHPRKKRRISRPKEDLGAMLLLNFALENPLPSKEMLVATFSRFGLLKESETQFLDDSSAQIFYERTTDAQFAIRRLEKNNPFGESLVSFKFHPLASASAMEMKETTTEKATSTVGRNHKKLHLPQPFSTADKIKVPTPQEGVPPNLTFIKKNVEMMKMTLEKEGDNLSPEMRTKLENEIKGFLDKIASMESASSPH